MKEQEIAENEDLKCMQKQKATGTVASQSSVHSGLISREIRTWDRPPDAIALWHTQSFRDCTIQQIMMVAPLTHALLGTLSAFIVRTSGDVPI